MENKDYIISGLSGISVILLILLGVNVMPDHTHYCKDLNISMHCDRLSSTSNTCYPEQDTTKGKKYCNSGWENIIFEIEQEPKEDNIIIDNNENIKREVYECSVKECKLKGN